MSLYKEWDQIAYQIDNQADYDRFWGDYLPKETEFYKYLLTNKHETLKKTVAQIAELFNVDVLTVIGFVDGINTSLVEPIDMETLEEDTSVSLEIDLEKLYYNMLDAKAEWLYGLPQWDDILSVEKRKEIKKEYNKTKTYVNDNKIGRNNDCPCGSGKKYKKCCGKVS
ncbi:MAG: SEC-C metal-binding domain-containing protein [Peptostreptococcaceae bacterium]|nr:SEC-C metal-binding domain-containing protein [Peptostreptococcaceae bacterium]